jgi:hypothetical protein
MQLDPRKSAGVFTALGAWLALLIASVLPVWTVWYFNEWEGLAVRGTLWSALAQLPGTVQRPRTIREVLDVVSLYESDLIFGIIAFALGSAIGRFTYWRIWGR